MHGTSMLIQAGKYNYGDFSKLATLAGCCALSFCVRGPLTRNAPSNVVASVTIQLLVQSGAFWTLLPLCAAQKKNGNKSDTVGWARVCALRLFDICREMHSLTVNSHLHWALPSSDLQSFNFWHTVFFHFHSGTVFLEPSIYRTSHLETWGVSELLLLLSVSGRGKLANTAAAWASVQPFTLGHSRSVCACVCCRILCVYYIRLQIYIYRDARERRHAG